MNIDQPSMPTASPGALQSTDPSSGPKPQASTPPPTQQDIEANFPSQEPKFEEFSVRKNAPGPPPPLVPAEPLLDNEIQQITAEEFERSIKAAEHATEGLRNLKLPRSVKDLVELLGRTLTSTKRTFHETGEIPAGEAIKIQAVSPGGHTSHGSNPPPQKRLRKSKPTKPVDLLSKKPVTRASLKQSSPPEKQSDVSQLPPLDPAQPQDRVLQESPSDAAAPIPPSSPAATNNISPNNIPIEPAPSSIHNNSNAAPDREPPPEMPNPKPAAHIPPPTPVDPELQQTPSTKEPLPTTGTNPGRDPTSTQFPSVERSDLPPGAPTPEPPNGPTNPSPDVPPNSTASSNPSQLTIIKSDDVRIEIIKIHEGIDGAKPSWQRYQTTWTSLTNLVQFWAQSMQAADPPKHEFNFQRTTCSYPSWIQTISGLAKGFLSPSHNEQWYCPDVLDFDLLAKFGNKENPPEPHISIQSKTPHPESTLVRFLYRLAHPSQPSITEWSKIVAASVELMADNLYAPPAPITDNDDQLVQGVQVLKQIEAIKNSSSSFDTPDTDPSPDNPQPAPRASSGDVLHEFRSVILDVYAAYIIFQTHALSQAPLSQTKKKAESRNRRNSARPAAGAITNSPGDSSELANVREESTRQMASYQRRQNFQPLIFFLLGGVRGLFLVSRNYRSASTSDCMSFIQAMTIIKQHSTSAHTPAEPIWKNLAAYLVTIFAPAFSNPTKISHLLKNPTRHEIAEAITVDFLNHWRDCQPTSPFLIPHSARQIPES
ncbi:hypothetical protein PGT21_033273 [Puccinia graminis f. sp. tritici]|uniref:Uncharacterized protein n=1 Tax=Puccinia graminis f. sp. tritici TaxID=56615 RepID=A0A5B0R2I5_PUCGR|nr:hypothetical protein PGT21_032217 [Puccinia graminis f. sp. tritici]KAA1119752.1 hypothetical protein PGT21_033273 [Puccinia graminis f. sp. tritici]